MSLETWLEEFYPVEAEELARASDIECTKHSLLKWRGLQKSNLKKHGLEVYGSEVSASEDASVWFSVDAYSCALCVKHQDAFDDCGDCPLFKYLETVCDGRGKLGEESPYSKFMNYEDPKPMIKALKGTLKMLEGEA